MCRREGRLAASRQTIGSDCWNFQRSTSTFTFLGRSTGIPSSSTITIPQCTLFGGTTVVTNLQITLAAFPTYQVSGTVAGTNGSGSFNGQLQLNLLGNLVSAGVTITNLVIPNMFSLSTVQLNWQKDAAGQDQWTGVATLTQGGPTLTWDFRLRGGQLTSARIAGANIPLFELRNTLTNTSQPLLDLTSFQMDYIPSLRQFDITGNVRVLLAQVSPIRGTLVLNNQNRPNFGRIQIDSATLINYIKVNDLDIAFVGSTANWRGKVDVELPGLIEVNDATIAFDGVQLEELSAEVKLGQPVIPIALLPGSAIYRVKFGMDRNPPSLTGGLGAQWGPTLFGLRPATADGDVTLRFPNNAQTPGFRVAGDVAVMNIPLGDAYVDYSVPASIDVQGCLGTCANGFKFGIAEVTGRVRGQVRSSPLAFQIEGQVGAALNLPTPSFLCNGCNTIRVGLAAKAILSDIGVAVCGQIQGWSAGWAAGMGFKWKEGPQAFVGCDLSGYASIGGARQAGIEGECYRPGHHAASDSSAPGRAGACLQVRGHPGPTADHGYETQRSVDQARPRHARSTRRLPVRGR